MTAKNVRRLNSFHYKAIKRMLGLRWECVKEERIMHEEVRNHFNNIPNIKTLIVRRTNRYIGKIMRLEKNNILRKLLGAWIHCPRKTGRPQNSCIVFFYGNQSGPSGHRFEPYIRSSYMVTHVVTLVVCLLTASRQMKNVFCFLFCPFTKMHVETAESYAICCSPMHSNLVVVIESSTILCAFLCMCGYKTT